MGNGERIKRCERWFHTMPLIICLSGPEDRLGPYKSDIIWTGPLYLLKVYKFYGPNIKHLGAGDRFPARILCV